MNMTREVLHIVAVKWHRQNTVMIELLKEAIELGIQAKYVLFDTWFSNPAQISDVHKLGLNTIAMIKNQRSESIHYGET